MSGVDRLMMGAEYAATEEQTQRLVRLIAAITYKPGWVFRVRLAGHGSVYSMRIVLSAEWPVTDVATGRSIQLYRETGYAAWDLVRASDADIIRHFIYRFIWQAEEHEMHEWFKVDGEHVVDPHPEVKKTAGV